MARSQGASYSTNRYATLSSSENESEDAAPKTCIENGEQHSSRRSSLNPDRVDLKPTGRSPNGFKEKQNKNAIKPLSASLTKNAQRKHAHNRLRNLEANHLCHMCSSIFHEEHSEQWFTQTHVHHTSRVKFDAAVRQGCDICVLIQDAFAKAAKHGTIGFSKRASTVDLSFTFDFEELRFIAYGITILQLRLVPPEYVSTDVIESRLSKNTCSEHSLTLARKWLANCIKAHQRCRMSSRTPEHEPRRLIHLKRKVGGISAKLCNDEQRYPVSYLTLSHCWGSVKVFQLTSQYIEQLEHKIPVEQLPRVFQDAMLVTAELGYEYLWIDSLCILQDSTDDWLTESSKMGSIYQNADCNIAATGFSDGTNGLFVERDPRSFSPKKIYTNWRGHWQGEVYPLLPCYYVVNPRYWKDGVESGPLNRRGWFLQERLLSPRTLHFGDQQVFWECPEVCCCEVYPSGVPLIFNTRSMKLHSRNPISTLVQTFYEKDDKYADLFNMDYCAVYIAWQKIVAAYSHTKLTRFDDKLPAFSGTAKYFRQIMKDEYIAGLWKGRLLLDLLWFVNSESDISPPQQWVAPSWSWASVNAGVKFFDHGPMIYWPEDECKVVSVEVSPLTNDDTSCLVAGVLTLRGRLAFLAPEVRTSRIAWMVNGEEVDLKVMFDTGCIGLCQNTKHVRDSSIPTNTKSLLQRIGLVAAQPAILFPLMVDRISSRDGDRYFLRGLILRLCEDVKGRYKRIGVFEAPYEVISVFHDVEHVLAAKYFLTSHKKGKYTIEIV